MSLHEQLKELNSAKQFEEICALYDSSSIKDAEWTSEWDYVYLMHGLYKQKRYRDGLDLYKKYIVKFPGSGGSSETGKALVRLCRIPEKE